jgi:hypothetical protein
MAQYHEVQWMRVVFHAPEQKSEPVQGVLANVPGRGSCLGHGGLAVLQVQFVSDLDLGAATISTTTAQ